MKKLLLKSAIVLGLVVLSNINSLFASPITDDFSSGNLSGGVGWLSEWTPFTNHSGSAYGPTSVFADPTVGVLSANPLKGGGNYLSVVDYRGERGPSYSRQSRKFDKTVVDMAETHSVSFDFRLDRASTWSAMGTGDLFGLAASRAVLGGNNRITSRTDITWGVVYDAKNGWQALASDGAGGSTRIAPSSIFRDLVGDSVFSVTINVFAKESKFSISVTDGNRVEDWGGMKFAFVAPDTSGLGAGDILNFFTQGAEGTWMSYSVDNVAVNAIPEPGAVALSVGTLGVLGAAARRRSFLKRK